VKRKAAIVAALLAVLGAPVSSGASSPSDAITPNQRTFEVVIAGSAEDTQVLRGSLQELVKRLGLQMRVTTIDRLDPRASPRYSSDRDVVVRAWIDLRSPDTAVVMLSDPKSNRPIRPRQVARQGSRGLFLEEVAYVTHVGAESVLAGEPPDDDVAKFPTVDRPATPQPPATEAPSPREGVDRPEQPPVTPRAPKDMQINLATFATAEPFVKETGLVFGGGVGAQLVVGKGPSIPTFWLLGEYHLPFGNGQLPVELNAHVWSLRLIPTWQLVKSRRFLVESGVGGGADIFVVSPGATQGVITLDANRTDASPILTATLGVHVLIGPSLTAFAAGLVDWDLTPRVYVAAQGPSHMTLLQTRVPRPGFAIGFSFNLLGGGDGT
jgi:hypothetical protein